MDAVNSPGPATGREPERPGRESPAGKNHREPPGVAAGERRLDRAADHGPTPLAGVSFAAFVQGDQMISRVCSDWAEQLQVDAFAGGRRRRSLMDDLNAVKASAEPWTPAGVSNGNIFQATLAANFSDCLSVLLLGAALRLERAGATARPRGASSRPSHPFPCKWQCVAADMPVASSRSATCNRSAACRSSRRWTASLRKSISRGRRGEGGGPAGLAGSPSV